MTPADVTKAARRLERAIWWNGLARRLSRLAERVPLFMWRLPVWLADLCVQRAERLARGIERS